MTDPVKAEKAREIETNIPGVRLIRWVKGDKAWFTLEKQWKKGNQYIKSDLYFDTELAQIRHLLNTQCPELDGIETTKPEDDDQPY